MKIALSVLIYVLAIDCFSQKIFYSTDAQTLKTESEIIKLVRENQDRYTKLYNEKYYGYVEINETIKKKDSIIHIVNIIISTDKRTELFKKSAFYHLTGNNFPDFNLSNFDGGKINLSHLKGKPTIIHLWFSRCPPCIEEVPTLQKLKEIYQDDFNFVTMTFDSRTDVRDFLKKYPLDFLHIINAQSFIESIKIKVFPTNIFLDKNGTVKYVTHNLTNLNLDKNHIDFYNQNEIKLMEFLKIQ